jgi:proline iminopeptidase
MRAATACDGEREAVMRSPDVVCCLIVCVALIGCQPAAVEVEEAPAPVGLENGSFGAELNGFNVHYEVHGQGPVLMTVPNSWGLTLTGLRALYRPLEERVTMVYFDPRGMGESDPIREESDMGMAAVRQDFDALRQHLGLDTVNAIGWSNGCTNLVLLASEYPSTLEGGIFLHGVASFTPEDMAEFITAHPRLMELYMKFQQEVIPDESLSAEEKTKELRTLWLDEYFPLLLADPETAEAMVDAVFGDARFSALHADYSNQEMGDSYDLRDRLPQITARSLVIAGAQDAVAVAKVREIHDGLADSEFVVFESSGHFAPVEEPEAFKQTVWDFLGVG